MKSLLSLSMAVRIEELLVVLAGVVLVLKGLSFLVERWWRPRKLEAALRSQGLKGPPRTFRDGNLSEMIRLREMQISKEIKEVSHDILAHVLPEVALWSKTYGKPYVYWYVNEPRISVFDPESARAVLSKESNRFEKPRQIVDMFVDFIGHGLIGVNGDEWSEHRNILSPAFKVQKLKGMVTSFKHCTQKMVSDWKSRLESGVTEVDVTKDLNKTTGDAISHTAFGSNYEKGERVLHLISQLAHNVFKLQQYAWLPFFRYYPTPLNIRIWRLRSEIHGILRKLIHERRTKAAPDGEGSFGDDLLGLILKECEKPGNTFDDQAVMDECKTFYIAGQETTSRLLSWTLLLLAINPEWQERARAEVQEHCGGDDFDDVDADLAKLKVVGMILNETLRLYPASTELQRTAQADTVVNGLKVPKGAGVTINILALHHDTEIWGPDANEFNPERFVEGVANACKHPNAFLPFSFGPRVCIGQAFAMMEAKVVLVMLLKNFRFKPSPYYKHALMYVFSIYPIHGIQVMVENLSP